MDRILLLVKENIRLLLGAAVLILTIVIVITLLLNSRKSTKVFVNGQTISVMVAKTDKEKQVGLSGRNKIGENQGMLFIFDTPNYYSFWMKEMKFPIDIIYINGNKITTVVENAKPPLSANDNLAIYQPSEKSDKVLELNAGSADKLKIKTGAVVEIESL